MPGKILLDIREPVFKVTQSFVREKFSTMIENFRKKEAREARASGVDVEITKGLLISRTEWIKECSRGKMIVQRRRKKLKKKNLKRII